MPNDTMVKPKRLVRFAAGSAIAESARLIMRALLWFAAMTAGFVLAALTYARFQAGQVELRTIVEWLSKLSTEPWVLELKWPSPSLSWLYRVRKSRTSGER
ncbi:MAG TPA: hypothetical protein VEU11_05090 [Terriglobales bacterium]|nr:hypothetical protein [Terriglobales bacterium]